MKKIAIIGANEYQQKLVLKAKDLGFETHVFAWEDGAVAKDNADYFYPISITDKDRIYHILEEINVNGVCSIASDLAMPTVNYIAEKLNLAGNSIESTILTTNKYEMRKKLNEHHLPVPAYQLIKEAKEANNNLSYPLIVKPIDRSGSRGIYKVHNKDELTVAINKAKKVSFTEEILIEDYIVGEEYSIEAISQNGEHHILQITEKFTTESPNFIEMGHLSPARIDDELKDRILKVVDQSLTALKVRNGASHSEVKVTESGEIIIIEVAARMGGDFIGSDMVQITTNFDYVKSVLQIAMGEIIDLNYKPSNKYAFVRFIFNQDDINIFNSIKREYSLSVKEYTFNKKFHDVTDSSTRNGYYILELCSDRQMNDILQLLEIDK